MADFIPVKALFSGLDVIALGEFNPGDTIALALISGFPAGVTLELGNNSIDALGDVSVPTPANNEVLTFNSTSGNWEASLSPGSSAAIWGNITGTLSDQLDLQAALDLKADQTSLDTHTGDASIHFTEANIDHTAILNVGTNTHTQVDTHIAGTALQHPASVITFDNTGTNWTDTNVQGVLVAASDNMIYREPTITGITSGGLVSLASTTTIDITGGSGHYVDSWTTPSVPDTTHFTFAATTGMTVLLPNPYGFVSIYVDQNGIFGQKEGTLTNTERRAKIYLARVFYHDGTIDSVTLTPRVLNSTANSYFDYLSFIPNTSKISGFTVKAVTGALSIWQESGNWFSPGVNLANDLTNPNIRTFPQVGNDTTPLIFDIIFQDGSTYLASQTVIPTVWESAPGVVTAVGGNDAVIHYFFKTFGTHHVLQLAQTFYNNGKVARDSLMVDHNDFNHFDGAESTLLSAQIYVQNNTTDFSDSLKAGIVSSLKAGGGGGSGSANVAGYLSLSDIIDTTYVGQAGKVPTVDATEVGLEFTPLDSGTNTHAQIDSHIASTLNPHSVTQTQIGLSNVDNTTDLLKPISTATQTALDGKLSLTGGTMTGTITSVNITPSADQVSDIGSDTTKYRAISSRFGKFVGSSLGNQGPPSGTVDIRGTANPTGLIVGNQVKGGAGAAYHYLLGGTFKGVICAGNTYSGSTGNAQLKNQGGGSSLFGSAFSFGAADATIQATGFGNFTTAYAYCGSNPHTWTNAATGGFMAGYSSGGGTAAVTINGPGSFLNMRVNSAQSTGTITITGSGAGSFMAGQARTKLSSVNSTWSASGTGASIIGASNGSDMIASGKGSSVSGYSLDTGSNIRAYGDGSTAMGVTTAGFNITASGAGSLAVGSASVGVITASATNASQFGVGTNSQADSLQVGTTIRLKGTTGAATTLQNGDMWVDATGDVWVRTGGVSKNMSNIV